LLLKLLHTAELRLRLQAFLAHFGSSSSSNFSGLTSSNDTSLQAFLASVKDILALHDAAMLLVLQQRRQQQQMLQCSSHRSKINWRQQQQQCAAPSMTLLQLVTQLRVMTAQLEQLATCCWCTVAAAALQQPPQEQLSSALAAADHISSSRCVSTSTQALLGQWQPTQQHTLWADLFNTGGASGNSGGSVTSDALPWPGLEAAWVQQWGWQPSKWQVQGGFLHGNALVESLYHGAQVMLLVRCAECVFCWSGWAAER
jgi:hypothetical protein